MKPTSAALKAFARRIARLWPAARSWLYRFHGGVFPQYNKSLSAGQPIRSPLIPDRLTLHLEQQAGLVAEPVVKPGDHVKKNQLLAKAAKDPKKALTVPIHAPTSGRVEAIRPATLTHPSGLEEPAIILKPDGMDQALDNVLQVDGSNPASPAQLKEIILKAGIIGMGGAGFPTYAKIPEQPGKIHTLLINGAECEPFITCDDLLMQRRAEEIIQGALITAEALGAQKILCGIETNKPDAIQAMQSAARNTAIEIVPVATVYPMGGQKQLILELTGIEMPHKAHAVDLGLLMMNVATFAAIFRAVRNGEPLTSRLVTVSGLGLKAPFNIHALIGTPFSALAEAANPKTPLDYPLIMGGPMMGVEVKNNDVPVIKTTNCILANPPEPVEMQMPCIRCGECMDVCPVNLLPQQMYWYSQAHEYDKVEQLKVFDCIECGCCSYVCPSHIPLVQYYRHAKSEIKEIHAEEKAAEQARQRHEFRLERLEREKREREARLKAKKEAVKKQAEKDGNEPDTQTKKRPASAAAAAKAAAAKRAAQKSAQNAQATASEKTQSDQKAIPPARLKAIEAAKKAAQKSSVQQKGQTQSKPSKESASSEQKDPKAAARQAAMQAAKKRAAAKKDQKHTPSEGPASSENNENKDQTSQDPAAEKRRKALEAARRRAAQRKSKQSPSDDEETPS